MHKTKKVISLLLAIAMVVPMAFSAIGTTASAAPKPVDTSKELQEYLTKNVDKKYIKSTGKYQEAAQLLVRNSVYDKTSLEKKKADSFDEILKIKDKDGYLTLDEEALLFQSDSYVGVYDLDPSNDYVAAFVDVSRDKYADKPSALDVDLAYNNDYAQMIEGYHYDKKTGIVYIPKSAFFVEKNEIKQIDSGTAPMRIQLLVPLGEDDLNEQTTVSVISNNAKVKSVTNKQNNIIFDTTCEYKVDGLKDVKAKNVEVYVNGMDEPLTDDSFAIEENKIKILASPAAVQNVEINIKGAGIGQKVKDLFVTEATAKVSFDSWGYFRNSNNKKMNWDSSIYDPAPRYIKNASGNLANNPETRGAYATMIAKMVYKDYAGTINSGGGKNVYQPDAGSGSYNANMRDLWEDIRGGTPDKSVYSGMKAYGGMGGNHSLRNFLIKDIVKATSGSSDADQDFAQAVDNLLKTSNIGMKCSHISLPTEWIDNDPSTQEGYTSKIGVRCLYKDAAKKYIILGFMTSQSWTQASAACIKLGYDGYANGHLKLHKDSTIPTFTNGNPCYDFTGTQYTVYESDGTTVAQAITGTNTTKPAVFTLNASGDSTEILALEDGNYVVKETKKAKGYALDPTPYPVTITPDHTTDAPLLLSVKDVPQADPIQVLLRKFDAGHYEGEDSEKGTTPVAGASLAGAEFTVTHQESGFSWVFKTPESGIIDRGNMEECLVSGPKEKLFEDKKGLHFPIGSYKVTETKAPTGYVLPEEEESRSREFVIEENGSATTNPNTDPIFDLENLSERQYVGLQDDVERGDVMFVKVDENGEPIINCPFLVVETKGKTQEAHIVVTGRNGVYNSASAKVKQPGPYDHSFNTNKNDDYVTWKSDGKRVVDDPFRKDDKMVVDEEKLTYEAGTWFSEDQEGDTAEPNDEQGAFPYSGAYQVKEVRAKANEEWGLISFGVDMEGLRSADSGITDLGTKIDREQSINTTAYDKNTKEKVTYVDTEATVVDKVEYYKLKKGEKYTLKGELHVKNPDGSDGGVFVDPDGKTITAQKQFTADKEDSSTTLEFTFNCVGYDGRQFVVFEELYDEAGEELVADHKDITDIGQTIDVEKPEIKTTAEDAATDSHVGMPSTETTIVDKVKYENLTVGHEYEVKGVLHLKGREDGKVVDKGVLKDKSGKPVEGSTKFTAQKKNGEVEIIFTFDSSLLIGETVVAFETVEQKGYEIAAHTDITDKDQSVEFPKPEIGTTALDRESGTHTAKAEQDVELVDTVKWKNLAPGEYTMQATIWDATAEKFIEGATGKESFTVKDGEREGSVKVLVKLNTSKLKGHRLVFFEECVRGDDNGPAIATTLKDKDGMQNILGAEKSELTDTVAYSGLKEGEKYTLICSLKDKSSSESVATKVHTFTAKASEGTEDVVIEANTSDLSAVVAFEKLYKGEVDEETEETPIATHEDLSDVAQSVVISKDGDLRTTLVASDGAKVIPSSGEVDLVDKVAYSGLEEGATYTLKCVVVDKVTKLEVGADKITFQAKAEGIEEVPVTVNATGHDLVAYEYLYKGEAAEGTPEKTHENINDTAQTVAVNGTPKDAVVAEHKDPDDEGQTVFISPVTLHTTLKDKDGDKKISPTKDTELVDTVIYTGLTRGKQYTMVCRIMDKKTKKEVGTASIRFTPQDANGTVDVPITGIDTTKLKGRSLVAFERCYIGDKPSDKTLVALHEDINDKSQTVVVNGGITGPPGLKTGDKRAIAILVLGIIIVLCAGTLVAIRKRKS